MVTFDHDVEGGSRDKSRSPGPSECTFLEGPKINFSHIGKFFDYFENISKNWAIFLKLLMKSGILGGFCHSKLPFNHFW